MTRSERNEEKKLSKFLKDNGQPVGVLVERGPTGLFEAVTANGKSVQTGKPFPKGTKIRLFGSTEIVEI